MKKLFVLIFYSAVTLYALRNSTALAEFFYCAFSISAITTVAGLALLGKRQYGCRRIVFSATAAGYLLFAHIPDTEGFSPRQISPDPITRTLRCCYSLITKKHDFDRMREQEQDMPMVPRKQALKPQRGGVFGAGQPVEGSNPFDAVSVEMAPVRENAILLPPPQNYAGSGPYFAFQKHLQRFLRIGHSFFACVLGYIAAEVAGLLQSFTNSSKD